MQLRGIAERMAKSNAPLWPIPSIVGGMSDGRRWIYLTLDLLFAAVYVLISRTVARSADGTFELASLGFAACAVAMAAGAALRHRAAWWLGVGGCVLLLLGATALIVLLGASAGYLHGVFGALGQAAAVIALVGAALVVELYLLLPLFQLRWLLARRA